MLLILIWSITGTAQALSKTNRLRIDLSIETGISPVNANGLLINPNVGISYMFSHVGIGLKTNYFGLENPYDMAGYETTLSDFLFMKNPKYVSFYTKNRVEQLTSRTILVGFGPRYQIFGNCNRFNIELGLTPFYMKIPKPVYSIDMSNVLTGRIPDFNIMNTTFPDNYKEQVFGIIPDLQILIGLDKARQWSLYGSVEYIYVASVNEFTVNTRDLAKVSDVDNEKFLSIIQDVPYVSETFNQIESSLYANVGIRFSFGKCESKKSGYIPPGVNNYSINDEGIKRTKEGKVEKNVTEQIKPKEKIQKLIALTPLNNTNVKELKDIGSFTWELLGEKIKNPQYVIEVKQLDKNRKPSQSFTGKTPETKIDALSVLKADKSTQGNYQWEVTETTTGISSGIMYFNSNPCDIEFSIDNTKIECLGYIGTDIKYKICFNSIYQPSTGDLTYIDSGSGLSVWNQSNAPLSPTSSPSLITQLGSTTSTVNYCFEVVVPASTTQIGFGLQGDDVNPTSVSCLPGASNSIDSLPSCICTACDSIQINIPSNGHISIDSTLSLQTPVSVTPRFVKTIKAQLVYFEYKPETDDCVPCNRNSNDWGNFIGATLSDNEFSPDGLLTHGHELQWNNANANGATLNGNFNFHISLPPLVNCCKVDIKFCIRYIFEFTDCTVCEKVVCYSYSKTTK
jgi:hypothetical protein